MKITNEQLQIIESDENILVNAGAGTGKTSTLLEYAKHKLSIHPYRILYLVYNKEMQKEALIKFKGLNVEISTIHSFAYKKLCTMGKKPFLGNTHKGVMEKAIGKELSNSTYYEFTKQIEYYDSVLKSPSSTLPYYEMFELFEQRKITQSHNNYLKEYCKIGVVDYDYILVDEAQDIAEPVLDWLERQSATKVYVGDTNQAIYMKLNYTVNVFELLTHKSYKLTQSFRSSISVLTEANDIMHYKHNSNEYFLRGLENGKTTDRLATICYTNTAVYNHAILTMKRELPFYVDVQKIKSVLYNVSTLVNVFINRKHDFFYSKFSTLKDVKAFAYKTENFELADAASIVLAYGGESVVLLNKIEQISDKNSNYFILTAHGAKGLEFDVVDYVSSFKKATKIGVGYRSKDTEILNLMYVAATRASKINLWLKR